MRSPKPNTTVKETVNQAGAVHLASVDIALEGEEKKYTFSDTSIKNLAWREVMEVLPCI